METKFINSALLNLRKQMIRGDDTADLHHVVALLVARDVDMPAVLPAKLGAARQGHMAYWITAALADGPLPFARVADYVGKQRPSLPRKAVCSRTGQALNKLKHKGHVVQDFGPDGCLWRISDPQLRK